MEKIVVVTPGNVDATLKEVLDASENYEFEALKPDKIKAYFEDQEKPETSLAIVDAPVSKINDIMSEIPVTVSVLFLIDNEEPQLTWKNREFDIIYKPLKKQELELRISNVLKIKILRDEITSLSLCDDLTGLFNRQYLLNRLEEEMSRSKRYETPITVMLMDIDYFKVINDMYGYEVGDKVLKKISGILKNHVRKEDIVTRYGDEEFVIALPNTTDRNAYVLAERIRKDIKNFKFFEDEEEPMSVTISIGISSYPFPHMEASVNSLIRYAEHSLYNAKKLGKNRVILFSQINFDL
jgi:diguanylate cyclase (GGDEF)-like protein